MIRVPDEVGHNEAVGLGIRANEEALKFAQNEQLYRAQVWSGIASSWAQIAAQMTPDPELEVVTETHNEGTLFKVREALEKAGLGPTRLDEAVNEMQNAGILFRERTPEVQIYRHP